MAVVSEALRARPGIRTLSSGADIEASAESTFALLRTVEKWPVWLSLVRSAELTDPSAPVAVGSEILLRSAIPGGVEDLYEVAEVISNHRLTLVGAFSCRRRIEFRVERKTSRCRLSLRIDYPAYGGKLGSLVDQMKTGRKLATLLDESALQFKGLAEFENRADRTLSDF